ncbi:hypothetical protein MUG91_G77n111 [Manis pentadactyla]|nr:hypothetical protein MUG91_G77n111 [Manis pentadactyla]
MGGVEIGEGEKGATRRRQGWAARLRASGPGVPLLLRGLTSFLANLPGPYFLSSLSPASGPPLETCDGSPVHPGIRSPDAGGLQWGFLLRALSVTSEPWSE